MANKSTFWSFLTYCLIVISALFVLSGCALTKSERNHSVYGGIGEYRSARGDTQADMPRLTFSAVGHCENRAPEGAAEEFIGWLDNTTGWVSAVKAVSTQGVPVVETTVGEDRHEFLITFSIDNPQDVDSLPELFDRMVDITKSYNKRTPECDVFVTGSE